VVIFESTSAAGGIDELSGELIEVKGGHTGMSQTGDLVAHPGGHLGCTTDTADLIRSMDNPVSGHGELLQNLGQFGNDFVEFGTLAAVKQTEFLVEVDQGLGLFVENSQTALGGFERIVSALIEFRTAFIADAFGFGRHENFVVNGITSAAIHPGGEAFEDDFVRDIEVDDGIDFFAHFAEDVGESFSLGDGTGETVEDESVVAIGFFEAFADHTANHGIGDEAAGFHDGTGFFTGGGAFGDFGTQDIAGGDVGDTVFFDHFVGNGSFTGTGAAEENQIFFGKHFG
jgi:hypothetical protein